MLDYGEMCSEGGSYGKPLDDVIKSGGAPNLLRFDQAPLLGFVLLITGISAIATFLALGADKLVGTAIASGTVEPRRPEFRHRFV